MSIPAPPLTDNRFFAAAEASAAEIDSYHSGRTKTVKLFWILFVLAAAMPLLGRAVRKGGLFLSFLCIAFSCAGAAVCVLSGEGLMAAGTGTAAVLLTVLWAREGGEAP